PSASWTNTASSMPSNNARASPSRSRGGSAFTDRITSSGLDWDMKRILARRRRRTRPPGGKVFIGFRLYHRRDALHHRPLPEKSSRPPAQPLFPAQHVRNLRDEFENDFRSLFNRGPPLQPQK